MLWHDWHLVKQARRLLTKTETRQHCREERRSGGFSGQSANAESFISRDPGSYLALSTLI
jgi:hypothetical protein